MTTHTVTHHPVRTDLAAPADPAAGTTGSAPGQPGTRWALVGLAAAVTGIGAIVSSGMVDAVYSEELAGDSAKIAAELGDQVPQMLAFHVLSVISATLMVVFAAGLHRRLRATAGPDSLAPAVSSAGVFATAMMLFVGSALDTEFIFAAASDEQLVDPTNLVFFNNWIGTVPWCWGLLGLSGLALFAVSRAGGVARWLGLVGLVGGGLTLLLGVSPLQYMAGMTGPIGLLVVALGFLAGDRAYRHAG